MQQRVFFSVEPNTLKLLAFSWARRLNGSLLGRLLKGLVPPAYMLSSQSAYFLASSCRKQRTR